MGRLGARASDVVIAHDFAETYGGAKRIIAAAAVVFPDAPFWAIAGRRSVAERMGVGDRFHTLLPESDALLSRYRLLAPACPSLVRIRRLPPCDVLLTSSYAFAHGFRARNGAPQVCYCYSPLRFIWSMSDEYGNRWAPGRLRRGGFNTMVAAMRRADRRAASRVTRYVSESNYVADQVRRHLGRESEVIYPPVDCDSSTARRSASVVCSSKSSPVTPGTTVSSAPPPACSTRTPTIPRRSAPRPSASPLPGFRPRSAGWCRRSPPAAPRETPIERHS